MRDTQHSHTVKSTCSLGPHVYCMFMGNSHAQTTTRKRPQTYFTRSS